MNITFRPVYSDSFCAVISGDGVLDALLEVEPVGMGGFDIMVVREDELDK